MTCSGKYGNDELTGRIYLRKEARGYTDLLFSCYSFYLGYRFGVSHESYVGSSVEVPLALVG